MPKGSERPYNRAEKKVVEGMKELRKSGSGQRRFRYPGVEGQAPGVGTFSLNETSRQKERAKRSDKAASEAYTQMRNTKAKKSSKARAADTKNITKIGK